MQNENSSSPISSTSGSNHGEHGSELVEDTQEAYRRALVELVAKVMHPPDFTKITGISQRTSRFEWCMNINKLLRKFKSIASGLAPADVPPSFEDLDVFIRDACQFAFTDEVTGLYAKWPADLDTRLEESYKTGKPLGRMMIEVPSALPPGGGNEARGRDDDQNESCVQSQSSQSQPGSAADSAAVPHSHGQNSQQTGQQGEHSRSRATSDVSSLSFSPFSPTAHGVTPTTPLGRTPSLDSRAQTSTQSSGTTPFPLTPSSVTSPKRFTVEDFEKLVREASKSVSNSNPTMSRTRMQPRRGPAIFSSGPAVRQTQNSENPSATPESFAPPPPPSATPVPEHGRSVSIRRSVSERPWLPESYRDGSMAPEIARTYSELDKVCEEADILIFEAYDLDARDGKETRLKPWTERARDCELKGRKFLNLIAFSANKDSYAAEVEWARSTLRVLKAAHVELMEFAEKMLSSASGSHANKSIPQARIEAVRNLQPAIRHSVESTAPPESRAPTTEAATPLPEARRKSNKPGPSRSSTGRSRMLVPYIEIPRVPWKWRPASPEPNSDSEPESAPATRAPAEPKPNRARINTSSIVIRTRQVTASVSSSSSQNTSGNYRTVKLQRMTDRAPGDEEFVPACSGCAQRGFSCFGKAGLSCRRCRRIKKGGCTYARKPGRPAPSASATLATTKVAKRAAKKGIGKTKESATLKTTPKGKAPAKASAKGKGVETGIKRIRSGRSSGVLEKLRSARMRLEKNADDSDEDSEGKGSASEDGSDSDYASDGDSNVRMPARKRRRGNASARASHEPEHNSGAAGLESAFQTSLPTRGTSEPPDNNVSLMRRGQSRRPRLTSLARSPSPLWDWNMDDAGMEGAPSPEEGAAGSGTGKGSGTGSGSGSADVDIDSQSTLRSTEPERGQATSAPQDRSSASGSGSDVQIDTRNTSERETEAMMEIDRASSHRSAGPETRDRLSVSTDVHHSISPPQAIRTSVANPIPTPTSLTGESPTGTQMPLPSIAFPLSAPTAAAAPIAGPSSSSATQGALTVQTRPWPNPERAQRTEQFLVSISTKIETMMALQMSFWQELKEGIRNLSEPPPATTSSANADASGTANT